MAHRITLPIALSRNNTKRPATAEVLGPHWFQNRVLTLAGFTALWMAVLAGGIAAAGRLGGLW